MNSPDGRVVRAVLDRPGNRTMWLTIGHKRAGQRRGALTGSPLFAKILRESSRQSVRTATPAGRLFQPVDKPTGASERFPVRRFFCLWITRSQPLPGYPAEGKEPLWITRQHRLPRKPADDETPLLLPAHGSKICCDELVRWASEHQKSGVPRAPRRSRWPLPLSRAIRQASALPQPPG